MLLANANFHFLPVTKKSVPVESPPNSVKATISGSLDLNGVYDSTETINILVRKKDIGDFKPVITGLQATDQAVWTWEDAVKNQNYEVKAQLLKDKEIVDSSDTITVTAPAVQESLTFNITPKTPQPQPAEISGTLDINGYIPAQATLTIFQTPQGSDVEQPVVTGITAKDKGVWVWSGAESGKTYKLKAVLMMDGKTISDSPEISLSAPAANETLTVNSQAKSPVPQKATISGSINLNGSAPYNTRIMILQRVKGTSDYKMALDNINPVDGTSWSWNGAISGTTYDLMAVLKLKQNDGSDLDYAYSTNLSVSAPAVNETLSINTAITLAAPPAPPAIACDSQANNDYKIKFTFDLQNSASQYWLQIGTTDGGTDIVNQRINPLTQSFQLQGGKVTITSFTVPMGKNVWARYAYSLSPTSGQLTAFSSFSNTQLFTCPAK